MKTKILSFVLVLLLVGCGGGGQATAPSALPNASTIGGGSVTATGTVRSVGDKIFTTATWTCNGVTEANLWIVITRTKESLGTIVWAASTNESDLKTQCSVGGRLDREDEHPEISLAKGNVYTVWVVSLITRPVPGRVLSTLDKRGEWALQVIQ